MASKKGFFESIGEKLDARKKAKNKKYLEGLWEDIRIQREVKDLVRAYSGE